jgi:hypothetical protein
VTTAPAATVVICVYTDKRWDDIVEAVESVAAQDVPAAETIVLVDHNDALLSRAEQAARHGIETALLERDVVARESGEDRAALAQHGDVEPRLAARDRVERRLQFAPVLLEPEVVLQQARHHVLHGDVAARGELREDVAFLVDMVLARRGREMADDGGRGGARLPFDGAAVEAGHDGFELGERTERLPMAFVEDAERGRRSVAGRWRAIGTGASRVHGMQPRAVDAVRA